MPRAGDDIIRFRLAGIFSRTARCGEASKKTLWATVLEETKLPGPTRWRDRTKIAELLVDERCSQAVLDSRCNGRQKDGS